IKEDQMKYKKPLIFSALVVIIPLIATLFISKTVKPFKNSEYASTSVMITRYDGRSGGTGVVISSSRSQSTVLTNAHVCSLLKSGGFIRSDYTKGIVKSYQVSEVHDLCLITTNTNFKVNTVIADSQPEAYDDAVVSGHPHLLPNIVTHGHFSQKELVHIVTGVRPCTIKDVTAPENVEYCQHFGFVPIIKSFEAQVVSATIMPGSSGSAVFNSKGEIAGLVFAGSGEFGYGLIVPYEYIATFFEIELPSLRSYLPNGNNAAPSFDGNKFNWKNACLKPATTKIKKVCELVSKSLLLIK
ncbi:MAG: serine protease, partial [Alphaproteobacteria bacterium]